MGREDEIKLIAYTIWEEEGCIDGHDCEHWYRAEVIWQQQQEEKTKAAKQETKSKTPLKGKTVAKATA